MDADNEGTVSTAAALPMAVASKSAVEDILQRLQTLAEHFRTNNSPQSLPSPPTPTPAAAQFTNRAAVLICLFLSDFGELRVILTKRASTLSSHSAQKGMTVVPVLGLLSSKEAFNPSPNAAEVDAIFDVPLEMFLKDENRSAVEKEWMGYNYLLHFFDYEYKNERYVIWALTAGILIKAASLVFQRPPAFLELRPRFWNASANASKTSHSQQNIVQGYASRGPEL